MAGILKLECPPGLIKKQYSSGWGFYTRQDLSVKLIVTWLVVIVSLGVTFILIWLGAVDTLDVQTSLTPLPALASILACVDGPHWRGGVGSSFVDYGSEPD